MNQDRIDQIKRLFKKQEERQKAWIDKVWEHAEAVEDLITQKDAISGERGITIDPYTDTIILEGESEPFVEIDHVLVLAFLVLQEYYLADVRRDRRPEPVKGCFLFLAIAKIQKEVFGLTLKVLRRTFERKLKRLKRKQPALGSFVRITTGPNGGYTLSPSWPSESSPVAVGRL